MRRVRVLALLALVPLGGGCAWFRNPPEQGITTGATIVYAGNGFDVFSVCDKGNLVYMTQKNPQVAVVPGGCAGGSPGGIGAPGGPSPVAVAAVTERPPEPRTPPAPAFTMPQPFLVQLGPVPGSSELREPVVVQILPAPAAPIVTPAPKAAPKVATLPAPRTLIVPQLDPNTASADDLERLPGVTVKMAQTILRGRPYHTLHDLVDKKVLSETDLQALAPYFLIR